MSVIDTSTYVSEFTKNTLQQFGWKQGDPVPENLGELIQAIRDRTPVTKKTGVIIDIDLMSEADVAAVKAALSNAITTAKKLAEKEKIAADTEGMLPGIQTAYQQMFGSSGEEGVQIVDDLQTPATPPATEPAVEEAAPTEQVSDGKALPPLDLLTPVQEVFCPRCNWDMRQKYETEITEFDKENFLSTILGGTRFKKEYKFLKDKYTIVFRTLLAEENRLIHRQLVLEQQANEFLTDTEWFLKFFEYRMACSVDSVIVNDKIVAVVPELDEVGTTQLPLKHDDPSLPPLVRLHEYVVRDLFSSEIVRRLASKNFREFQRLYEALEAMALEPSFW